MQSECRLQTRGALLDFSGRVRDEVKVDWFSRREKACDLVVSHQNAIEVFSRLLQQRIDLALVLRSIRLRAEISQLPLATALRLLPRANGVRLIDRRRRPGRRTLCENRG